MANEEERVILTVEARDMLTAPLQAMRQSMDATATSTTAAAARQATGVQRAMTQINNSMGRATSASNTMQQAMNQATGSTASTAQAAGRRIDQRFIQVVTAGYGRLRSAVSTHSAGIVASWESLSSRASSVGSAIGGVMADAAVNSAKAAGIAAGIIGGVAAKAISGGLNRQMNIEDAQAKLVGLGSSVEDVKAIMDSAMESVKGTAFGLDSAATIAATAVASGIKPGQELTKYLSLVGDASTIAGVGLDEMGQIMGKVTNAGKVTNEVVQQFGDRGVGVLQMLAKEYGVTADEMTDMISKSKVDAKTFEKVLTENIGGAALKSGNTTRGALANMGAALSRVGVTLTMGFFPLMAKGYNAITETLDGMNKKIKPAGEAFAIWFGARATPVIENFSKNALFAFQEVIGSVRAFRAAFTASEDDITSSGLPGFMEHVGNAARKVKDGVEKLNPHMEMLRTTLLPLGGLALALSSKFLSFIPILGRFLPVLSPVLGILLGLIIASPELRAALGGTIEALVPIIGNLAVALTPVAIAFAEVVAQAALLVAWLVEKLNPALPVLVPLILGLAVAFKVAKTALAIYNGVTALSTSLQATYAAASYRSAGASYRAGAAAGGGSVGFWLMVAALKTATWASIGFTVALKGISAGIKAIPVIGWIIAAIGLLVAGLIWAYNNVGWFRDGVNAALDGVKRAFVNVVEWWQATFMPALSAVGQWFVDVFNNVATFLAPIFAGIGVFIDAAVQVWKNIIQGVVDFWTGTLFPMVEKIGQVFDATFRFVGDVIRGVIDFFVAVFTPAVEGVRGTFESVFGWIERFVWNSLTIIMTIFYALVDLWNGVLKPALDIMGGWFGAVLGAVGILIAAEVDRWKSFFQGIVDWWNAALVPALNVVSGHFQMVIGWIGEQIAFGVAVWQYGFGLVVEWWNAVLLPALQIVVQWFTDILGWIGEQIAFGVSVWQYGFGIIVDWWNTVLFPALQAIGQWFSNVFNWVYNTIIAPIVGFIVGKFNELVNFWNTVLSPVIDTVAGWFSEKIGGAINGVSGFITNLKVGFDGFIAFWTGTLRPVVDAIVAAFERVSSAVNNAVSAANNVAGGAIDAGKSFASNPLGGIQDWMGIEKDGSGQGVMPTRNSGGGVYPGAGVRFAGGGVLPGYAPGRDVIPAQLSPGESVLVPELTRAIGPANIMAANFAASNGRPAGSGPARAAASAAVGPVGGGGGGGTTVAVRIEAGAVQLAFEGGDASQLTQQDIEAALEEALERILGRKY